MGFHEVAALLLGLLPEVSRGDSEEGTGQLSRINAVKKQTRSTGQATQASIYYQLLPDQERAAQPVCPRFGTSAKASAQPTQNFSRRKVRTSQKQANGAAGKAPKRGFSGEAASEPYQPSIAPPRELALGGRVASIQATATSRTT